MVESGSSRFSVTVAPVTTSVAVALPIRIGVTEIVVPEIVASTSAGSVLGFIEGFDALKYALPLRKTMSSYPPPCACAPMNVYRVCR